MTLTVYVRTGYEPDVAWANEQAAKYGARSIQVKTKDKVPEGCAFVVIDGDA